MAHTQNPRAASDTMPEMIVKIIGSKYVRYPVDKSEVCPVRDRGGNVSQIQNIFSGIHDVESFRLSLLGRDRSSSGLIPVSEFRAVCESHGASIPLSTLIPLLKDNAFVDRGKIRWKKIVDLLLQLGAENRNKSSQQKDTVKEDIPVTSKEEDSPYQCDHRDISYLARRNPGALWESRPASEPALHLCEHRASRDEQEAWIDRFKKLENVLQLCQIKDTGLVETERAKQVIEKYNLIYSLTLSPEKITEALEKSHSGEHVRLEPALLFLKEL